MSNETPAPAGRPRPGCCDRPLYRWVDSYDPAPSLFNFEWSPEKGLVQVCYHGELPPPSARCVNCKAARLVSDLIEPGATRDDLEEGPRPKPHPEAEAYPRLDAPEENARPERRSTAAPARPGVDLVTYLAYEAGRDDADRTAPPPGHGTLPWDDTRWYPAPPSHLAVLSPDTMPPYGLLVEARTATGDIGNFTWNPEGWQLQTDLFEVSMVGGVVAWRYIQRDVHPEVKLYFPEFASQLPGADR